MSDEMQIEGKSYISSKRASQLSGYAQDYIGQLARKSLIDARRIGGLWYVSMESLDGYKKKAEEYKPEPPIARTEAQEPGTLVFFDGKEYLSAARAAELTGYAQDYVGQLGRSGKVLSQQVGNRWYVEKESILGHKAEKDSLLAAVQRESVGLQNRQNGPKKQPEYLANIRHSVSEPLLNYYKDQGDLMPVTGKEISEERIANSSAQAPQESPNFAGNTPVYSIPIKKTHSTGHIPRVSRRAGVEVALPQPKRSLVPLFLGAAATIVIVISVGYVSILRQNSVYALGSKQIGSLSSLPASVEVAFGKIGDLLEPLLTHELSYERTGTQ